MSGFTALNVEPEDAFEEEIDDTKEIQLEEAFKLYQNALKLHSQGPEYFEEALAAYKELLQSEIFKLPEVISEYTHDENEDEQTAGAAQPDAATVPLLPSSAAETSASSIPQLLYLAYKNRGQFVLDVAHHELPAKGGSRAELSKYYAKPCSESIGDFARALERDDADLDLWKRSARVAGVLSSQRIARFCLESVLAGDDEDAEQTIDMSGLDEAFAAGELEKVIEVLEDDLSRLRSSNVKVKDPLLAALRKTNDPYSFLPKRAESLEYLDDRYRPLSFGVAEVSLHPTAGDFCSLGRAIQRVISDILDGPTSLGSATTVKIALPDSQFDHQGTEMSSPDAETSNARGRALSDIDPVITGGPESVTNDVAMVDSPQQETPADANAIANAETGEHEHDGSDEAVDENTIVVRTAPYQPPEGTVHIPRKRSATTAGNEELEGRTKSKRLRARESLVEITAREDEVQPEDPQHFQDQLATYEQADQAAFDVANSLLAKFKLNIYLSAVEARQAFWQGSRDHEAEGAHRIPEDDLILLGDLKMALKSWSDEKGQALIQGHGSQDFPDGSTGMSLFLQHSKATSARRALPPAGSNEYAFSSTVKYINAQPTNIYDAAYHWLFSALVTGEDSGGHFVSSYMRESWSEELKQTVVQLATATDAYLLDTLRQSHSSLAADNQVQAGVKTTSIRRFFELVQTLFELHIEVHSSHNSPSGTAEDAVRIAQDDRLRKWANLTDDFMQLFLERAEKPELTDTLVLRFIWASTTHATTAEEVDKNHVVLCLEDLKAILERAGASPIYLPNNTAMPVISMAAVDQEISRLSTLDFFTSVFDSDNSDPVAVIEKLEPILEPTSGLVDTHTSGSCTPSGHTAQAEQLMKFLESGDAGLKLFLWRRLQNAYTAISYPPKVVSCLLRGIETSFHELRTIRHLELDDPDRHISILKWLRDIDELMLKVVIKLVNESNAFECVDEAHLLSALGVVTGIVRLLHGFVVYEDSVRVGQTTGPQLKGAASYKLYDKSKDRFREMLVRAWTLQYLLLKEAAEQDPAAYPRATDDLAEYLGSVHHMLGIRHYCRYANKSFLKLAKSELGTLKTQQDYSADMSQVLFDLYQLHFITGIGDRNHGCPIENMDKKTAAALIPIIMQYVGQLNMKDILKSELKGTIEKIQSALGVVKSTPAVSHNKRIISAYLKSTINANDLYQSVRGIGDLQTRPVQNDTQSAASQGWYFLLGYLALAKYKSVKRVQPTPTDDLDVAGAFFRQDLDHAIDKWETWYRLAQVYEAKIEDDLIWNSTKLNDSRGDIALLERQAVHCYVMATALALRTADDKPQTAQKVEEMFAEFGSRLYASSRPPLNMEAFKTDKNVRYMSSIVDQTMSKQPYYKPFSQYTLWHFAEYLLSRKFTDKPKPWMTHYTRTKCLWKMFQSPANRNRVTAEDVVDAIVEALGALPKKEKSNEPVLEPHYKIVSIVHKMVKRRVITPTLGQEYLQATRFAHGIHLSDDEEGVEWESYVLDILHKLEHADKSNWHHRITARAAHVLYDEDPTVANALGAKYEFTKQIFTKTMTIQVWKPENERPGRHYVYTSRYVTFFAHLLEQLGDRVNLDQLVRRIRRKTTDFLDHAKIWEEVVTAFVRSLRRLGKIPDGKERMVFDGMNHEEFTKRSEQLGTWSHEPDTSSVYLDIMKDGVDLKRLNNSLMKGPLIDDLIGDSYACLYEEYVRQLPPEEQPQPQPPVLPQGTFINMTTDVAQPVEEDAERSRLNDLLRAQGDGAADGPLSVSISAPVGLGLQNSSHQVPSAAVQADAPRAPARPGRVKTVTRREIQRKAEAAIVKPPPIKTPILGKRPIVEIPLRVGLDSPLDKRLSEAREGDADGSKASSRRGSMQDSADGEADEEDDSGSDLSEVGEIDNEKKQLINELQKANECGDEEEEEEEADDAGDEQDEAAGDGDGDDGEDDGGEDDDQQEEEEEDVDDDDDDDEEMVDAGDLIEIQDSQDNAGEGEVQE
ncbi:Histone transcription regulator 3 [Exophiala xenobiotica]|nr:Histone transcription regulator 3 [Exophiala xenobiotica]KAK5221029.1 Histone transcription regulator 3 [Exophiala xenobiotica]KAK5234165.1 Histone transcription regulator 3 [Exophiala xenobiotica]KAK5245025.1 Histone transcription regulator 3 [Exophiala xenobiotica]KAK5287282.1 Histone transcription regulator 3 [Exophiala xenobiotica]